MIRLHIVTGKGGVGKSTVTAAWALALAQNQRVLVCELYGSGRLAKLLGAPRSGNDIVEAAPNLFLCDMTPALAMTEYARMRLKVDAVFRAVFEHRLVQHFLRLVPALGELVMLGKLWFHEQEVHQGRPRFDVLLLDAPATGHAISMLRSPDAVERAVPKGPLKRICRDLRVLLSERSALTIVTTAEEMPVNEAMLLERRAHDTLNIPVERLVINRCEARMPCDVSKSSELWGAVLHQLWLKQCRQDAQLERLPAQLLSNAVRLPFLDAADVKRFAECFRGPA